MAGRQVKNLTYEKNRKRQKRYPNPPNGVYCFGTYVQNRYGQNKTGGLGTAFEKRSPTRLNGGQIRLAAKMSDCLFLRSLSARPCIPAFFSASRASSSPPASLSSGPMPLGSTSSLLHRPVLTGRLTNCRCHLQKFVRPATILSASRPRTANATSLFRPQLWLLACQNA